jgi:hypothetical protein
MAKGDEIAGELRLSGIVTNITFRSEPKHSLAVHADLTMTPIQLGYTSLHDVRVLRVDCMRPFGDRRAGVGVPRNQVTDEELKLV